MTENNTPIRADLHVHSEYSHDSDSTIPQIYKAAIEKNINIVCVTDHCDLYPDHNAQQVLEFRKQIVDGISKSIDHSCGVELLIGVELGGGFIMPELAQAVVDSQPYDMIIGSAHGIMFRGERKSTAKFDFGAVDMATTLEYLDRYMDSLIYIAEKLDVDVLAHLTYIFRYINGKYGLNLDWHIQEEKIRRVMQALIKRGIALEINTSYVGSSYNEWLPSKEIVDIYLQMGGRLFTLGSDAHKSEKLAHGFEEVKDYLKSKGVSTLAYYKKRILHTYSI